MPFEYAATTAKIGISSMIEGIILDSISIEVSAEVLKVISPVFSPLFNCLLFIDKLQFIFSRTSINPILVLFKSTLLRVNSELSFITAIAAKKAADDGSDGIVMLIGLSLFSRGRTLILLSNILIVAPILFSIISV